MSSGREREVERVRRELLRRGWPRVQMSLILLLTGVSGFLVSAALLGAGVALMWVRYPVAILLAYAVFLLLLRFWLFYQLRGGGGRDGQEGSGGGGDALEAGFELGDVGAELLKAAGRAGRRAGGRAAALPLRRRRQRPGPAGPADEHHERRRARRGLDRLPGVHGCPHRRR